MNRRYFLLRRPYEIIFHLLLIVTSRFCVSFLSSFVNTDRNSDRGLSCVAPHDNSVKHASGTVRQRKAKTTQEEDPTGSYRVA
jgi:hypothetical protein